MKTGHTIKCLIGRLLFRFSRRQHFSLSRYFLSQSVIPLSHSTFSLHFLTLLTLYFFTFLLYFLFQHSHSNFFSWISLSPFSLDFLTRLCSKFLTFHYYIFSQVFHFTLSLHFSLYFLTLLFFITFSLYFASPVSEPTFFPTLLHFSSDFSFYFISLLSSLYCLSTLIKFSLLSFCTLLIPSHFTHSLYYSNFPLQFITIISL